MEYNFNIDLLTSTLKDFSKVTGNNICIVDSDFNILAKAYYNKMNFCKLIQSTSKGLDRCMQSDRNLLKKCAETKTPQTRICHAGLTDIAIPVFFEGKIIAYALLGQIKKDVPINKIYQFTSDLDINVSELKKIYNSLKKLNNETIKSIINITVMLTEYILLRNIITPDYNNCLELSLQYIEQNLHNNINIDDICAFSNVSKSSLYKNFNKYLSTTPIHYINKKRIQESEELLIKSDISITEVMYSVGFTNLSYFYKIFKKETGITPKEYQENHINSDLI